MDWHIVGIIIMVVAIIVNAWETVKAPDVAVIQFLGWYVSSRARSGFFFCFLQGILTFLIKFNSRKVEKSVTVEEVKTPDNIISTVHGSFRYSPDPDNPIAFIESGMHEGVEESFKRAIQANTIALARKKDVPPLTWKQLLDMTEQISHEIIRRICNGASDEDVDAIFNDRANHHVLPWGIILHKLDLTKVIPDKAQTDAESAKLVEDAEQETQVKNMETMVLMAKAIETKFPGMEPGWYLAEARNMQNKIDKSGGKDSGPTSGVDPNLIALGNNLVGAITEIGKAFAASKQQAPPETSPAPASAPGSAPTTPTPSIILLGESRK